MGTLLKVIGIAWVLIGAGILLGTPWAESSRGGVAFGFMLNMLIFAVLIPGLVIYFIGAGMKKREDAAKESASTRSDWRAD
jgi:uncharacterized membrane protein